MCGRWGRDHDGHHWSCENIHVELSLEKLVLYFVYSKVSSTQKIKQICSRTIALAGTIETSGDFRIRSYGSRRNNTVIVFKILRTLADVYKRQRLHRLPKLFYKEVKIRFCFPFIILSVAVVYNINPTSKLRPSFFLYLY